MIKAIIFDIDGVLIDSFEANLKFFQKLMLRNGYRPPTRKEYKAIFHLNMMDVIKTLTKSTSEEELNRIWEMGRGREVEYDEDLLKMPEGSKKVIETLSEKYVLAIVTNRIKENVYESPYLRKLKRHFKVVVSCQDTINHKPHPEPLLFAAKKLKAEPEECVYIGDAETDIQAAKAAKMKIILYPKKQLEGADIYAGSFTEIPNLVLSLNDQGQRLNKNGFTAR